MKPRDAALGTDIGDEAHVHPINYQVISVDGQCKDIMMINDGTMPVLYSAGSLVIYANLIKRGTTPPGQAHYPFDPGEAAKDPFGVGNVTPAEIDAAIKEAIQSRLDDHPEEWETLSHPKLIKGVFQYSEGESRQIQDVRKRYVLNLQRAHVTTERVMFVQTAQADLDAQGPNRDHAPHHASVPQRSRCDHRH